MTLAERGDGGEGAATVGKASVTPGDGFPTAVSAPRSASASETGPAEGGWAAEERGAEKSGVRGASTCEFGCGPTGEEYVDPGFGLVPACPVHGWLCVLLDNRAAILTRYREALEQIGDAKLLADGDYGHELRARQDLARNALDQC